MKRVLQVVLALGFGFFAVTSVASAQQQQSCSIDNTGPQSVQVCVNTDVVSCSVENNTKFTIDSVDYQVSQTGDVISSSNTTAGNGTSGPANNSSSTNINIVVANESKDKCTVTTTTRTPVVTTSAPAASTPAAPVKVKALPKTNGTSPAVFAGATAAVLLGVAVASRFGLAAYSKIKG